MKTTSAMMIAAAALTLTACGSDEMMSMETAAEPMVAATTDYTVYFGFNRSDLTTLAQETVSEAASAAAAATSVSVVGHTDTVGSVAYNQGLSEARAAAVVGAMVAEGVNPAVVTASGRSELDLAVATADGVREARNRRVEISVEAAAMVAVADVICVTLKSDGTCETNKNNADQVVGIK